MNTVHNKELGFHDEWAGSASVAQVKVHASFEAPTALETQYIMKELGSLRGLHILDVGAGLGEASVYFALQGAIVTATDLSPEMARFQQELAAHHHVSITSHVGPAETLELNARFDIIYTANLIHHLTDKEAFIALSHRLLKTGGRFVSWDPLRYNPCINIYRRIATKVRTEDERPLGLSDFRLLRRYFPESKQRFFWLATQTLFLKYFLVDRTSPNSVRYWKRIYEENASTLGWWRPLAWLDKNLFLRLPGLRWLAWNAVFIGKKT